MEVSSFFPNIDRKGMSRVNGLRFGGGEVMGMLYCSSGFLKMRGQYVRILAMNSVVSESLQNFVSVGYCAAAER
jgi:hypothetical protein